MTTTHTIDSLHGEALWQAADKAVRAIPPAWPLTATVAVNPFLGQAGDTLEQTSALLARIGGIRLAASRQRIAHKMAGGEITDDDLLGAIQSSPYAAGIELTALKAALLTQPPPVAALPTIADLAAKATGQDWPGFVSERIGAFAAGYFDEGQALWAASRRNGLYAAWRAYASHDLTPEIFGLKGFGFHVIDMPESPRAAIERAAVALGLGAEPGTYFHQLLLTLGGWAQLARHLQFKAEMETGTDTTVVELLALRLVFEEALYHCHKAKIETAWQAIRRAHAEPVTVDEETRIDGLLQLAVERAMQRRLAAVLASPATTSVPREGGKAPAMPARITADIPSETPAEIEKSAEAADLRPMLQAAFCIDVRSEVFRRALESLDPAIRTLGFAGFFGLAVQHRAFASDVCEARLPVLLRPSLFTCSAVFEGDEAARSEEADRRARFRARAIRAWGRFKLAAVSSFAFVEAMGPVYAGKLLRDGLGLAKAKGPAVHQPHFSSDLDLDQRGLIAETVLKAMSLTDGFGRIVLICGHGANVVNNPHESSLHCGACGGYSGDINARLLAGLLNEPAVRGRLAVKGIDIPEDTIFIAALHDTTTDRVSLFEADLQNAASAEDLALIRHWLDEASRLARAERSLRLPQAREETVIARSRDWSQVRPELGLAGCRAFIAAPRSRSRGRVLGGQVFLHDYVWQKDEGFKILELILTAPVVVASWISLQYFGSCLAPPLFGAGNKLLHNVVGGMGVVEGNGGNLRAGLAWQSVHDGEDLLHDPMRLTVAVEAPKEAITGILQLHPSVRALFDHGWLHLLILDARGQAVWRYAGELRWAAPFETGLADAGYKDAGYRAAGYGAAG